MTVHWRSDANRMKFEGSTSRSLPAGSIYLPYTPLVLTRCMLQTENSYLRLTRRNSPPATSHRTTRL
jgi:hypothetical protein